MVGLPDKKLCFFQSLGVDKATMSIKFRFSELILVLMRIPSYDFGSKFSVVQEVMRLQTVKHFLEPVLEPLIRKVVRTLLIEYSSFS